MEKSNVFSIFYESQCEAETSDELKYQKNKELLLSLTKLSGISETYHDSLEHIENLSKTDFNVTEEEIELFNRSFKYTVSINRRRHRKVSASIEKEELQNSPNENIVILKNIKEQLESNIKEECEKIIRICLNFLNLIKNDPLKRKKEKLFFQKSIADHCRYLYEIDDTNVEYKTNTIESYRSALKTAEGEKFDPTDLMYLTFFLNYCVFLYDVVEETEEAIKRAKEILYSALKETEEIIDSHDKDVILICQMLKDNLSLWKIQSASMDSVKY